MEDLDSSKGSGPDEISFPKISEIFFSRDYLTEAMSRPEGKFLNWFQFLSPMFNLT